MATATRLSPSPATINLSSNDAAVLQALFDSESSSASASSSSSSLATINPSLPDFPCISSNQEIQSVKQRELEIVKRIQNVENTCNNGEEKLAVLQDAIREFDCLIEQSPRYPPLYVNRAQALRMLIQASHSHSHSHSAATTTAKEDGDDSALFLKEYTDLATQLWADLTQAISLSTITPSSGPVSVSPAQARLLSAAHTHRGYILLKAGKLRKEAQREEKLKGGGGPQQLHSIATRDELEEMASREFFQAGRFGNEVAREVSVQTNPYAKMCGAIVKEAMRKEIEEFNNY